MKKDVLLFTQTMYSLLSSHLSLQNALKVCSQILTEKTKQSFVKELLKKINEGKKLSQVLMEYKKDFAPLYISLVAIGEESGTLAEVFGHLSSYLKSKNNMTRKIIQALFYPVMVLITAVVVVIILTLYVMPRLEGIFEAFSSSSSNIAEQMGKIKVRFIYSAIIISAVIMLLILCLILRKADEKAASIIDSAVIKIPLLNKLIMTLQINDFSFAMKLFSLTHFPLVQSFEQSEEVITNKRIKKSVDLAIRKIMNGSSVGEAFESERIFPKYFTVWVKIAEENGNTAQAFCEISDYYRLENENILTGITQAAEPVFILITGAIIISIILQFVIPVFNLLGAL